MSKCLYYGGSIYTMEEANPCVEAVVTQDDKIVFVGEKKEAETIAGEDAERKDLQGRAMFPAFIDAHSHLTNTAMSFLQLSLHQAKSIKEIQEELVKFVKKEKLKEGTWIQASGYDHNVLQEKRHPNREELDAVFGELAGKYPIVLIHQSGHMGVFNSCALENLGIDESTKAPEGGKIEKKNGILTGYLEENAFIEALKKIPMESGKRLEEAFIKAQNLYASYGITTIQDGMLVDSLAPLFRRLCERNCFFLDVVGYVDMFSCAQFFLLLRLHIKQYHGHFKIGGYKVFLDGSPQGRTAWMRKPYLPESEQGETSDSKKETEANTDYYGYPTLSDAELKKRVERAMDDKMQLLAHCNGDAAVEQYITVYQEVMEQRKKEGKLTPNIRPVMIHAQFLAKDQLKKLKACHMIPSFFIAHIYYWGEVHKKNMGWERASSISLAGSAKKKGIRFTFHQDTPVILPNMLETIWCAVNRQTKEGEVLGADECLTVEDAWRAVTIDVAYQYGEEKRKGSIASGKVADFVILEQNPFQIEKEKIRDILIAETIREGKSIYKRTIE